MAEFHCDNLGIHLKSLTSSVLRPHVRLGRRSPTEEDEALVKDWMRQLPQADLDSGEMDLGASLLVYATQQWEAINEDDISALIRAQRQVLGHKYAEAVFRCATGKSRFPGAS